MVQYSKERFTCFSHPDTLNFLSKRGYVCPICLKDEFVEMTDNMLWQGSR